VVSTAVDVANVDSSKKVAFRCVEKETDNKAAAAAVVTSNSTPSSDSDCLRAVLPMELIV